MATLLLGAAGAAFGSLFGGVGLIAGRAAGALAGYALDQALFSTSRKVEGPRLSDLTVQGSTEGAPIPRVYGKVRLAGQVIWATDFEEVVTTTRSGGKGGPKVTRTDYSYYANFAVGICEGEIARIARIWADGKPLDQSGVNLRVHRGTESQAPDPLIVARTGAAPAYRGLAYVVLERLPLADFGNRLPQLSFEVIRPVGSIEAHLRAVTVIPSAGEFTYDTAPRLKVMGPGSYEGENVHAARETADWDVAIDELAALCPRLEWVTLVVAWFGTDLRAGACEIRPMVDDKTKVVSGGAWSVAGLTRGTAEEVSRIGGRPAYGGTPNDAAVVAAIKDLKARGFKVALLPFILMDIPAGNGLTDPYTGGAGQPPYPWRGRITGARAPGVPGSPDKTAAAASEIASFLGSADTGDFGLAGETVSYAGPDEWRYRRFILHHAFLAKAAGGVDAFTIGSEMVGLTQLRSSASVYPFVGGLRTLLGECRAVLGGGTDISYAADWSEYFGHQPQDGTGDVFFHLDPLWAEADFVGIDMYWPLADWRGEKGHADEVPGRSLYNLNHLRANLAGGEGFDWYYASPAERRSQTRSAITDGAAGKPWVFRFKDIESWWRNYHYDRPGGAEAASPTPWVPEAKPIWLTEFGCPAVDKGANQPNVFFDPKSSESALPHFSTGERDDLMARRYIEAVLTAYDPAHPDYAGFNRPAAVPGGYMVDPAHLNAWTWDARPYPWFPALEHVWGDGPNWRLGHWLNGRLGALDLAHLIKGVLEDHGFADYRIEDVHGLVEGFLVGERLSARDTLEALLAAYGVDAADAGDAIRFRGRERPADAVIATGELIDEAEAPLMSLTRAQESELASEVAIRTLSPDNDYRMATAAQRRLAGKSRRILTLDLAVVAGDGDAEKLAENLLADIWEGRETAGFSLPPSRAALEAGDAVELAAGSRTRTLLIQRIADREAREIGARRVALGRRGTSAAAPREQGIVAEPAYGPPLVRVMELPPPSDGSEAEKTRLAAFAEPWPGALAVYLAEAGSGYRPLSTMSRRAVMGELAASLGAGPEGVFDLGNLVEVELYAGELFSLPETDVLAGGNLAAVMAENGDWEVLQFAEAELVGDKRYRLRKLLRAQGGSEAAMRAGASAGSAFVLLDRAVYPLPLGLDALGRAHLLRIGPVSDEHAAASFAEISLTPAGRGLKPFAPVHLSARRVAGSGNIAITFIRRTRFAGDSWELAEVPLNEAVEAYRLDILQGGMPVRSVDLTSPAFTYQAGEEIADFGAPQTEIALRLAQLSAVAGPGFAAEAVIGL
ncbi:baseplate multidomain protein megatron [Afifella pfennigii]|uniref:baseplate multidomain protein megatron n=1 Tax=Afifella pfennigii TaxID=209897 RepID=UPI0004796225|nr:glycoside hydrolase/phage tail family protein [Afifella pfennigii]